MIETIESLWNSVKFFLEPKILEPAVPPYLEREFLDFMKGAMGREYEVRETQIVDIDPDTV